MEKTTDAIFFGIPFILSGPIVDESHLYITSHLCFSLLLEDWGQVTGKCPYQAVMELLVQNEFSLGRGNYSVLFSNVNYQFLLIYVMFH